MVVTKSHFVDGIYGTPRHDRQTKERTPQRAQTPYWVIPPQVFAIIRFVVAGGIRPRCKVPVSSERCREWFRDVRRRVVPGSSQKYPIREKFWQTTLQQVGHPVFADDYGSVISPAMMGRLLYGAMA